MDLVQIACEGLMSAVDKFCLPYTPVFRSVIIGRIVGDFIANYSETLVHFYPVDKRKLYRANKVMSKFNVEHIDFDLLADKINEGVEMDHKTTPEEIADLLAAASCISTDSSISMGLEEPDSPSINRYAAPASCRPDIQVEQGEAVSKLEDAIRFLCLFDRKLLLLKGVALGSGRVL